MDKHILIVFFFFFLFSMSSCTVDFNITCDPVTLKCYDGNGNEIEIQNPFLYIYPEDIEGELEFCLENDYSMLIAGEGCSESCDDYAYEENICFVENENTLYQGICTYEDTDKTSSSCDFNKAAFYDAFYNSCPAAEVGQKIVCDSDSLSGGFYADGLCNSEGDCVGSTRSLNINSLCQGEDDGTYCSGTEGLCCNDDCVVIDSLPNGDSCCSDAVCVSGNCQAGICQEEQPINSGGGSSSRCNPVWVCSKYSLCTSDEIQTRTCEDLNNCGNNNSMPELERECDFISFSLGTGLSKPVEEEEPQEYVKYVPPPKPKQFEAPKELESQPKEEEKKDESFPSWAYIVIGVIVLGLIGDGIFIYYTKRKI